MHHILKLKKLPTIFFNINVCSIVNKMFTSHATFSLSLCWNYVEIHISFFFILIQYWNCMHVWVFFNVNGGKYFLVDISICMLHSGIGRGHVVSPVVTWQWSHDWSHDRGHTARLLFRCQISQREQSSIGTCLSHKFMIKVFSRSQTLCTL